MFRSIWFWVVTIILLAVLWLGRDQISAYFKKLPMTAEPRTTDTRKLAAKTKTTIKTPTRAHTATAPARSTGVAATPTPRPTRTPVVRYNIYVVKKGDTMYSIAKRYGTTVPVLQSINRIADPTTLYVGQELRVPKATPTSSGVAKVRPKVGTKTYVVKKGDTLSSIARKFQTSVVELQRLNKFSNPNDLVMGMTILVPAKIASSSQVSSQAQGASATKRPQKTPVTSQALAPTRTLVAGPTPTATPTPIPTRPSICGDKQEAVFVWGVSFCVPHDWLLQEYVEPHRTALVTHDETNGDRSIYAISRLEGSANAPLSWTMRQAKKAVMQEISGLIPGRLADPEDWTLGEPVTIAGQQGQMSDAQSKYLKSGRPAHVRVIVFNQDGRRWRIIIVAPEALWQHDVISVFPDIARTMEVY